MTGYVKSVLVTPPGVTPGNSVTLILRVFDGASYESSSVRSESSLITITVGGGTLPPANLVGLQGFSLAGPSAGISYTLTIPRGFSTIVNHLDHGGNTLAELLHTAWLEFQPGPDKAAEERARMQAEARIAEIGNNLLAIAAEGLR